MSIINLEFKLNQFSNKNHNLKGGASANMEYDKTPIYTKFTAKIINETRAQRAIRQADYYEPHSHGPWQKLGPFVFYILDNGDEVPARDYQSDAALEMHGVRMQLVQLAVPLQSGFVILKKFSFGGNIDFTLQTTDLGSPIIETTLPYYVDGDIGIGTCHVKKVEYTLIRNDSSRGKLIVVEATAREEVKYNLIDYKNKLLFFINGSVTNYTII